MRHFISLLDISSEEARHILKRASKIKRKLLEGKEHKPLAGKTLGMIFDKASTRTRVSFEVGMYQLGGHALFLQFQCHPAWTRGTDRGFGTRVVAYA